MDEIQVEILELQVVQGLHERCPCRLGFVLVVPEFAGYPQVLPFHHVVGEQLGKDFSDLLLVTVDRRAVDVPVSHFDSGSDRLGNGIRFHMVTTERSQADCRESGLRLGNGYIWCLQCKCLVHTYCFLSSIIILASMGTNAIREIR